MRTSKDPGQLMLMMEMMMKTMMGMGVMKIVTLTSLKMEMGMRTMTDMAWTGVIVRASKDKQI